MLANFVLYFLGIGVILANQPFCVDITSPIFNMERWDRLYGLVGDHPATMERLYSLPMLETFKDLTSHKCVPGHCSPERRCIFQIRREFYELLEATFKQPVGFNFTNATVQAYFYYKDKHVNETSPELAEMFDFLCQHFCATAYYWNKTAVYNCYCPNPCKVQTSCPQSQCWRMGMFEHQYECSCPSGQKWDYNLHACVSRRLADTRRSIAQRPSVFSYVDCYSQNACHWEGTLTCVDTHGPTVVRCICRPQYYGKRCDKLLDACKHKISGVTVVGGGNPMSGDVACNVHVDGNVCNAFSSSQGDLGYQCSCNHVYWSPDPELGYDNCLKRRQLCESIICVHGRCVTNANGTEPRCICSPEYRGDVCSEWVGEWTEWSPWDKCSPACGDVRYSVRSRDCVSFAKDPQRQKSCVGPSVEYAKCAEHPCSRLGATFIESYFAIRQSGIASSISAAAIACAVVAVLWSTFCWRLLSRILTSFAETRLEMRNRSAAARQDPPPMRSEREN